MKNFCELCKGKKEFIYNLNGCRLVQCKKCHTVCVEEMPSDECLTNYYKGFKYCINENNREHIINKNFENWYKSFKLPKNATMLDIGGGNGYFALAFESFKFGQATYIDLDSEACNYVEQLGITNVINDDVKNLHKYKTNKYDFIYARHVLEHLPNPLELVDNAIELLAPNGVLILQIPNGLSLERLVDENYVKERKKQLKESNNFSDFEINKILFSQKTAFDISPIRHLWAFSKQGFVEYLSTKKDVKYSIYTKSITDEVYSPFMGYLNSQNNVFIRILKLIKNFMRNVLSIPNGKAHLVVEIRKRKA